MVFLDSVTSLTVSDLLLSISILCTALTVQIELPYIILHSTVSNVRRLNLNSSLEPPQSTLSNL